MRAPRRGRRGRVEPGGRVRVARAADRAATAVKPMMVGALPCTIRASFPRLAPVLATERIDGAPR
eukprot:6964961-Lingulodinium_polyedra.AAC.1